MKKNLTSLARLSHHFSQRLATRLSLLALFSLAALPLSAANKYWDINGATAGAGGATPAGTWSGANWSTSSAGTAATAGWTAAADVAIFSAGGDATGTFLVSASSTTTAGGITVEEGVVQTDGSGITVNGAITINSGATLSPNGSARYVNGTGTSFVVLAGGTLDNRTTGAAGSFVNASIPITLSGPGDCTLRFNAAGVLNIVQTAGTIISGSGNLVKTGAGVLAISTASTYTGSTKVNDGELRMRNSLANRLPTTTDLIVTSPGIFNMNGSAQPQTVQSLSGNGDVGGGGGTLTIVGTSSTTYSGAFKDLANAGAAAVTSGVGRLTVSKSGGTGTLTLSGANAYNGTFTLTAGTVTVTSSGSLCGAICDVVVNAGTLNLNNTAQGIENLTGTGGTINLGTGHTLTTGPVAAGTYSGTINGAGSLIKTNTTATAAVLTLTGANGFTGSLTINGGSINFTTMGNLGAGTTIDFGGGGLQWAAANTTDISSQGRTITFNSLPGSSGATMDTGGNDVTFASAVGNSGAGSLTKTGAGKLTLSVNNPYSGATAVTGGTLSIGSIAVAGSASPIGTGSSISFGAGILEYTGSTATTDRPITLTASGGGIDVTSSGTVLTFSAINPFGNFSFAKNGSGTLVLSAASTAARSAAGATTTVNGKLRISSATALGTSTSGTAGAITVNSGAVFEIDGVALNRPMALNDTAQLVGIGGTQSPVTVANNGTTTIAAAATVTFATANSTDFFQTGNGAGDVAGGTGGAVLNLAGPGTISIGTGGAMAFSGAINVTGGIVLSESLSTFAANTVTVNAGAVLAHSSSTALQATTPITLNGGTLSVEDTGNEYAGTITLQSATTSTVAARDALVPATPRNITLSGQVTGSGNLTVTGTGTGTVTLSNAGNDYSGTTAINSGKLLVNGAIGGSGAVTVNSGSTLGGTGGINGVVTVNSGGTLAPGASIGTLYLTNAPTLSGDTSVEINRGGVPNADKLVVTPGGGTLTYGGTLTIANLGAALQKDDTFDLFDADTFGGSFTSISPATPGLGLVWDTSNLLVDGTIKAVCDGTLAANTATFERPGGVSLKIRITSLLTNVSSPAPPAAFTSVSAGSTNSGTITSDSTYVYYNPASLNAVDDVTDRFDYNVSDASGCSASGYVLVTVAAVGTNQTQNITGIVTNGDNNVTITFAGIPNRGYKVQATEDLNVPPGVWVDLTNNIDGGYFFTAGANGIWVHTDLNATNYLSRFYRSAKP